MKTKYFQNCLGVFQGGGVKAIAFAGAYEEAIKRGVFFSELIGTSAGSIIAVLIGAGADPAKLKVILGKLNFDKFLGSPNKIKGIKYKKIINLIPGVHPDIRIAKKYIRYLGEYNASYIRQWLDAELRLLTGLKRTVRFSDLSIPTSVVATDIKNRKVKVWEWEKDGNEEVALAVQTSCSIPFYFQPYEMQYVDGGLISNLPSFNLRPGTIFDKILAFSFVSDPVEGKIDSFKKYFRSIMETAIDGAVDLQLQMQNNVHLIKINTGSVQSTDFEKVDRKMKSDLIEKGVTAAKHFFDAENSNITSEKKSEDIAADIFETFNFIVRTMYVVPKKIIIADDHANWVYSLFPTLLKWKMGGAHLNILLKKNNELNPEREYKIRLLSGMGFDVSIHDNIPFKGFIFNANTRDSTAVVFNEESWSKINSKSYNSGEDYSAIKVLAEKCHKLANPAQIASFSPEIEKIEIEKISKLLKQVGQYSGKSVMFEIRKINVEEVTFLTQYIKGYKYRQIENLFNLYAENNIELFKPVEIKFANGLSSIITPPIIEQYENGPLILIEGNARLIYGYKNNHVELSCIIVKNVNAPLPSTGRFNIKKVLISDKIKRGSDRYIGFNSEYFRHIEANVHDVNTSLI